jgi:xanthine dehydrogenase FAD-binding subunit
MTRGVGILPFEKCRHFAKWKPRMNLWQNYQQPETISETRVILETARRPLAVIAGGTDLLIDLKQGRHAPIHTLVDLSRLKELHALEIRGGRLFIGACATISRLAADPLISKHAAALQDACNLIAGPQVRNVATLGGNVAHALPAADGTIALLALGATLEISKPEGIREIPLVKFFSGPGVSILNKEEDIMTGFYLPLSQPGQSSAFIRIMRPQGVALPILNCAVWLAKDEKTMQEVRIAVGPGGPIPFRAVKTEEYLRGKKFSSDTLAEAVESTLAEARFRTSARRATREYRRHLISILLQDTITTAWHRAQEQVGGNG